ncbi:MAG: glycosyl transferase [Melioribacteraceae bacterium]|nr:MAG: glycosyl transferase [Melioribacteraceae bacterium]
MKITVVTPTFNSAGKIAENVKSVLKQNYDDYEHIFIDNLSTDHTLDKITELYSDSGKLGKIQIVSERDNGISDAFNKGIQLAQGEIIVILNSDDEFIPDTLFTDISELFLLNPDAGFIHGDILFEDFKYGTSIRKPLLCPPEEAMPFNHPTMFVQKKVYDKTGLFDIKNRFCMDYDLIVRWHKEYPEIYNSGFYANKYPMVKMSAGGISWSNELDMLEEMYSVVNKYGLNSDFAHKKLMQRKRRVKLKLFLERLGLNGLVKVWRKYKWGN